MLQIRNIQNMESVIKWGNIRIRQDLIDRISLLETEAAQKEGFRNISDFTAHVLRNALEELEQKYKPKQLVLTNDKQDRNLVFDMYDGKPKCVLHSSDDCECVKELKSSRALKRLAKKKGFEIKD